MPKRTAPSDTAAQTSVSSGSSARPTASKDSVPAASPTLQSDVIVPQGPAVAILRPSSAVHSGVAQAQETRKSVKAEPEAPARKVAEAPLEKAHPSEPDATTRLIADGATMGHAWRETAAAAAKSEAGAVLPQAHAGSERASLAANRRTEQDASVSAAPAPSQRIVAKEAEGVPVAHAKDSLPVAHEAGDKSRLEIATPAASAPTIATTSRFEEMAQRVERLQEAAAQFQPGISALAQKGGGSMSIELAPEALGKMTLDCEVKDGTMSLKLVAESDTARDVLTNHAQAIRDVVENAGYALTQLDVQTRSEWTDQRQATERQASGTRRERKVGRETAVAAAGSGATSGARYDDGQAHAVWVVA